MSRWIHSFNKKQLKSTASFFIQPNDKTRFPFNRPRHIFPKPNPGHLKLVVSSTSAIVQIFGPLGRTRQSQPGSVLSNTRWIGERVLIFHTFCTSFGVDCFLVASLNTWANFNEAKACCTISSNKYESRAL